MSIRYIFHCIGKQNKLMLFRAGLALQNSDALSCINRENLRMGRWLQLRFSLRTRDKE